MDELTVEPETAAKPRQEPAQPRKTFQAGEGLEIAIGSRRAGKPPRMKIDFRAANATGRNATVNTDILPEYKAWLYQCAAQEGRKLCEVMEEMIEARYGKPKFPKQDG